MQPERIARFRHTTRSPVASVIGSDKMATGEVCVEVSSTETCFTPLDDGTSSAQNAYRALIDVSRED